MTAEISVQITLSLFIISPSAEVIKIHIILVLIQVLKLVNKVNLSFTGQCFRGSSPLLGKLESQEKFAPLMNKIKLENTMNIIPIIHYPNTYINKNIIYEENREKSGIYR